MFDSLNRFFSPPTFEGDEKKTRSAELFNVIILSGYFLTLLVLFSFYIGNAARSIVIPVVILFFAHFVLHIALKNGHVYTTAALYVTAVSIALTAAIIAGGTIRVTSLSFYILLSIVSGVVIGTKALYLSSAFNTLIVFGLLWAENNGLLPPDTYTPSMQPGMIFATASILAGIVLSLAIRRLDEALELAQREKELAVQNLALGDDVKKQARALEERTAYLEASAEVSRTIAAILDTTELTTRVVQIIKEFFDLYYVGLFLVDDKREWAVLKSGTGKAGKEMLANNHRLKVGDGMIGWTVKHGKSRIALDVGEDAVRFDNPHLPETRSEGALPLRSRGRVLGAITIQSAQPEAFTPEIIATLEIMADQVAIALDNATLFEKSEAALRAEQRAYGEITERAWESYLSEEKLGAFRRDENGLKVLPQQPHLAKETSKGTEQVPIRVRGKVIGSVQANKPDKREWTASEKELLRILTSRLETALDSARLYEDSQKQAQRERIVAETSSRMRETLNIEKVLETAAKELRNALGAVEAEVWVDPGDLANSESP